MISSNLNIIFGSFVYSSTWIKLWWFIRQVGGTKQQKKAAVNCYASTLEQCEFESMFPSMFWIENNIFFSYYFSKDDDDLCLYVMPHSPSNNNMQINRINKEKPKMLKENWKKQKLIKHLFSCKIETFSFIITKLFYVW